MKGAAWSEEMDILRLDFDFDFDFEGGVDGPLLPKRLLPFFFPLVLERLTELLLRLLLDFPLGVLTGVAGGKWKWERGCQEEEVETVRWL